MNPGFAESIFKYADELTNRWSRGIVVQHKPNCSKQNTHSHAYYKSFGRSAVFALQYIVHFCRCLYTVNFANDRLVIICVLPFLRAIIWPSHHCCGFVTLVLISSLQYPLVGSVWSNSECYGYLLMIILTSPGASIYLNNISRNNYDIFLKSLSWYKTHLRTT